jgi:hypothetical protein
MTEAVISLARWDDLRSYVHRMLCAQDTLDLSQTPLVRTLLTKSGKPCGVLFHVEGPRVLRTSAIWASDENRILFYDSSGQRSRIVRLSEAPELSKSGTLEIR